MFREDTWFDHVRAGHWVRFGEREFPLVSERERVGRDRNLDDAREGEGRVPVQMDYLARSEVDRDQPDRALGLCRNARQLVLKIVARRRNIRRYLG